MKLDEDVVSTFMQIAIAQEDRKIRQQLQERHGEQWMQEWKARKTLKEDLLRVRSSEVSVSL